MSDNTKSVIRNYISGQISSFWESFLEGWAIFDLFDPHWPQGCLKKSQNMWFIVIILLEMTNIDPILTPPSPPRKWKSLVNKKAPKNCSEYK